MIQIFALMMFFGQFAFISFGICVGNSIESKESELADNIMTALSAIGGLCFIIGLIGLLIIS